MSDAVREILAEWRLPVWLTLSILLAAVVYLRGWLAIRKTRRQQFSGMRMASFFCGLGILWLAIGSPMDGFADALLSAHMVEHLLLMMVVPPLLLCGLPAVPLLRGLPTLVQIYLLSPILRIPFLRRIARWMVKPAVAWLAMNLTFLGWHVPAAYDFALEHENWHAVEHLCFLSASLLFWWCVVRPWPAAKHRLSWGILLYLVSADMVNTLLSAFLAFCGRPVYAYYLGHANPFHVSPLDDQTLGAVVMWVFGSIIFLIPATGITVRLAGFNSSGSQFAPTNATESGHLR